MMQLTVVVFMNYEIREKGTCRCAVLVGGVVVLTLKYTKARSP